MKRIGRKMLKSVAAVTLTAALFCCPASTVYADAPTDAAVLAAQQAALMQTPEYQALLLQQQAVLAAQQQAALLALKNAQYLQQSAMNQAYLLNAIQTVQRMQLQNMMEREGLDYQKTVMDEFTKTQNKALLSYLGYYGM